MLICCKQALNKEQCLNVVDAASLCSTDTSVHRQPPDSLRQTLTARLADWSTSQISRSSVSSTTCVILHSTLCLCHRRTCVSIFLSMMSQSINQRVSHNTVSLQWRLQKVTRSGTTRPDTVGLQKTKMQLKNV